VSIKAHFDGKQVLLDESVELAPNSALLVTVLPTNSDDERDAWLKLGEANLARAYGPEEPEYSSADVKK
jgi:hypothetical protein